jgi:hypothetical protein
MGIGSFLLEEDWLGADSHTWRKADCLLRDVRLVIRVLIVFLFAASFSVADCVAQAVPSGPSETSSGGTSASPDGDQSPNQRVVLKVGDLQITQEQFETYIGDLEAQQGPADLSRKKLGDNYASLLMLSQQAVANHLDSSPEVIRQLAIDRTQILSNAEFARLKAAAKPTPAQINEYYDAHLDDYDVVQLRRVFIFKKGPGHEKGVNPEDAKPLAEAIRQAYASGSDPTKLVKDPDTVVFDGSPITFQHDEMPAAMEKVAFAMHKDGEWTELADDPSTLVLMQLVSRSRRSLSEMTPQIEKKLQAQNLKKELDSLKKNTGIWMDEEYFASHAPIPIPNAEPEGSGQSKSNK